MNEKRRKKGGEKEKFFWRSFFTQSGKWNGTKEYIDGFLDSI